jgi:murein DD-endopeptidase MepM/ murein hydrolase activator NlpD
MKWLLLSFVLLVFASCDKIKDFGNEITVTSPYKKYIASLQQADLDQSRIAQDWVRTGQRVLRDSIAIVPPYQELIYFAPDQSSARGYRLTLGAGQILNISIENPENQVFIDLFRMTEGGTFNNVLAADTSDLPIELAIKEEATYVLRTQSELLAAGSYKLTVLLSPKYSFPVQGKGNTDIWSFWGDPRDGGRRSHEGIDIFADRGTPVLAVTKGTVASVRDRGLGGKQVWLRDVKGRQSIYYAHLDSQLVEEGQRVEPLDTVGTIGNTGNAARTRPHLHFGIYKWSGGAIDPLPYVKIQPTTTDAPNADKNLLGEWVQVKPRIENLRARASSKSSILAKVKRRTALHVLGISGDWYHTYAPDLQSTAYIYKTSVQPAQRFQSFTPTDSLTAIYLTPQLDATVVNQLSTSADVVAQTATFYLIDSDGQMGWVKRE